jgi:hypothetical protein
MHRRAIKLVLIQVVTVAAVAVFFSPWSIAAAASSTIASVGVPEQAWASRLHWIDLHRRSTPATSDPLTYLRIQETFSRYGIANDENRPDVLQDLFTDDATMEIVEAKAEPYVVVKGNRNIAAFFASSIQQQNDQRRHCITNVVIQRVEGDEADALAYGIIPVANNGLILGSSVIYSVTLRKQPDGSWHFSHMMMGIDAYVGTPPKATQ